MGGSRRRRRRCYDSHVSVFLDILYDRTGMKKIHFFFGSVLFVQTNKRFIFFTTWKRLCFSLLSERERERIVVVAVLLSLLRLSFACRRRRECVNTQSTCVLIRSEKSDNRRSTIHPWTVSFLLTSLLQWIDTIAWLVIRIRQIQSVEHRQISGHATISAFKEENERTNVCVWAWWLFLATFRSKSVSALDWLHAQTDLIDGRVPVMFSCLVFHDTGRSEDVIVAVQEKSMRQVTHLLLLCCWQD